MQRKNGIDKCINDDKIWRNTKISGCIRPSSYPNKKKKEIEQRRTQRNNLRYPRLVESL